MNNFYIMVYLFDGSTWQAIAPVLRGRKVRTAQSGKSFSAEWLFWTWKKDAADHKPQEGKCNRKNTAGFFPVRVKRRGKSPPGGRRKLRRTGKPLPQQDQIGNELLLAALQVPGSGRTDRWLPPCSPEQGTESGLSQMLLFWEKFYRGKIYE